MATTVVLDRPRDGLIRWHYLWFSAAAVVVMVVAIMSGSRWFLNFVHVSCGLLWTGIDLFMGFIVGPIIRQMPFAARREFLLRLVPKTLFLMPTLSLITGTSGWFLASLLGYLDAPWPQFGWVVAALSLITLMTAQGLGYLLPTNLRVCFELARPEPDGAKIAMMMRRFFFAVALQGTMQVAIIVVMARFVAGM